MAEVRNLSNTRDTLEFVDLDEALPLAEGLDSELDESVTELLVTLRRSLVGFTDGWRASLFRGATGFVDDWRTSLFADIAGLSDTLGSALLPDYFEDAATWKLSGSLSEPSVPIEPMKTLNMAPSVDEGTASSVIPPCPSSHDLFDEAERAALRTLIENDARLTQGPRQDTPAQSSGWPMAPVWFWGPPAAAPRLRVSLDWVGVAGVLVGVLAFMFAFTSESERLALRDIALEVLWLCFILLSQ